MPEPLFVPEPETVAPPAPSLLKRAAAVVLRQEKPAQPSQVETCAARADWRDAIHRISRSSLRMGKRLRKNFVPDDGTRYALWLSAGYGRVRVWGEHPAMVLRRRAWHRTITLEDWVFDLIDAAEITEPLGRNEHLSIAQYRRASQWLSDERIEKLKFALERAGIQPLWLPERAPRDALLEDIGADPLGDLVRQGLID